MNEQSFLTPDWDVPTNIQAMVTTRLGGNSKVPWDSFNLALHVDDNPGHVKNNRALLGTQLPSEPFWLEQVHSNRVVNADTSADNGAIVTADGSYSTQTNLVCVVMTADCLPLLITNKQGTMVMALHAGWRGLAGGIIEEGITSFLNSSHCAPADILVWLGPAIGPQVFEVGREVVLAFQDFMPCESAFVPISKNNDKWLADIYQLARLRLNLLGIDKIFGGEHCTYSNSRQFFSYRRDGMTGRMASLIWIKN